MKELIEYLPAFSEALSEQIDDDGARWGDTWKKRSRFGQEERIFERFDAYRDQFNNAQTPVPWLKIAALAMIAWVRDNFNE